MNVLTRWLDRLKISGWHHVLFWLLYTAFWMFTSFEDEINLGQKLVNILATLFFHALVVYFNLYVLIPWFLKKKQYFGYSLSLLLSITLVCYPILYVIYLINKDIANTDLVWNGEFFLVNAVGVSYSIVITTALKLFFDWYKKENEARELSILQSQTELKFLKHQINPHFLFNSLNNLYSLSLKKSDLAPEVVLKLSEILRYLLYEASSDTVSLDREIEYLENYIEVEKLRFGNRARITTEFSGDFKNARIAPMLLIPFVENAFKHGLANTNADGFIEVSAELTEDVFFFTVRNNVFDKKTVLLSDSGGIGNKNVTQRLEILYPSRYQLNQTKSGNLYEVQLKLVLQK